MRFEAPYNVQQGENQLHFTYLDTTGRPVVVIHKSNLVEQHIQDFQVGTHLLTPKAGIWYHYIKDET